MMDLLEWLEGTGLASWMTTNRFAFPVVDAAHVLAVVTVFGTILIVDLRLVGLAWMRRSFHSVAAEMLKWTWLAFALAVASGLMMFMEKATSYFDNPQFRVKMLLILIAGINMLIFELIIRRRMATGWESGRPPRAAILAGLLSIVFWIGVIFLGRWTGFTIQNFGGGGLDSIGEIDLEGLGGLGGLGLF
jgi:hypothetical protein